MYGTGAEPSNGFLDGNLLGYSYIPFNLNPATQTRSTAETGSLRQALQSYPNLMVPIHHSNAVIVR